MPPRGLFDEFCARFPYEETDDQLNAIGDVLEDLGKGQPMDRLICGDVGFGKTEVALRAAFVMAMSGRRWPSWCPTTLLARQHFKTFTERFEGWPCGPPAVADGAGARRRPRRGRGWPGEIEIVVGTHAVLSEQVGLQGPGPGHRR
jgi:transcription-repair coupling factor (superfamily II helicase)